MEGKLGRLSRRLAYLVHETVHTVAFLMLLTRFSTKIVVLALVQDQWQARSCELELLTEKLGQEADVRTDKWLRSTPWNSPVLKTNVA
jgi:hypothetical protein